MDPETRQVLEDLGWTSSTGIDAAGRHYEAWFRLDGSPRPDYFFVYQERASNKIVRPNHKRRTP